MTDRELLEYAAKAAGWSSFDVHETPTLGLHVWTEDLFHERGSGVWNPLTNDGDALRLAMKLGLVVDCSRPSAGEPFKQHAIWIDDTCNTGTLTRLAIVRAAAEIGKNMEAA